MRVSTGAYVSSAPSIEQLPWFLDMAEVMVVVAILEDKDVDLLEVGVARMEVDRVPLRKDPAMQALWMQ